MEKYKFVATEITTKISNGVYSIGQKLPTETILAKHYNVSRHTIRKALEHLSQRGYVATRQGSGSYITNESGYHSLDIHSFSEHYQRRDARNKVIKFEIVDSNDEFEKEFMLPNTNKYFHWIRLRFLDGNTDPIQLEYSYVPQYLIPDLKEEDLKKSVYRYIETTTGYSIDHALKEIIAVNLKEEQANLLNVAVGYPATVIKNIAFLTNGEAFEISTNYHINQRIKYYAKKI